MSTWWGDISDLFSGLIGGGPATITQGATAAAGVPSDITKWLTSAGGDIASGLESGFIAAIHDIWTVILGPLEVILGALLILSAIVLVFKNDVMAAGQMFGFAAMA